MTKDEIKLLALDAFDRAEIVALGAGAAAVLGLLAYAAARLYGAFHGITP